MGHVKCTRKVQYIYMQTHLDVQTQPMTGDTRIIPRRGRQLLERNEWRQLIWQADQFAIRRQTIC